MTGETKRLWGYAHEEYISSSTLHEAILKYVEDGGFGNEPYPRWPRPITFQQYEPMQVSRHLLNPLTSVLQDLDEEYGHEDFDPQEPTDAMKEAEQAFLDAVLAEYVVCQYEPVQGTQVVINVRLYMAEVDGE